MVILNALFTKQQSIRSLPACCRAVTHENSFELRCFVENLNARRVTQRRVAPTQSNCASLGRATSSAPVQNRSGFTNHAACNRSKRRAGARGGGCAANPRCVRMRSITARSSITAMIFSLPPHCGQRSISMSKTRFRRRAQVIRARAPCAQSLVCPVVVCAGGVGTIAARSLALGASAP